VDRSSERNPPPPDRWTIASWVLLGALLVGGGVLERIAPGLFRVLLQEDGWVEWGTFVAFLLAGVLALHAAASRAVSRIERLALAAVAIFCVFVAGEEISWGQRIAGFVPPELFLSHNYQQEANLHNLLKGVFETRWQVFAIAAGYGIAVPLAARRGWLPASIAPGIVMLPWGATSALLEAVYPVDLTGEAAELLLGLGFLADVAMRRNQRAREPRAPFYRTAFALQLAALAAGAGLGPLIDRVRHGPDSMRAEATRDELDLLAADLSRDGALTRRLVATRRMHKRMFTAIREGYVRFGEGSSFLEGRLTVAEHDDAGVRRDRRGYFLDVWNQPYWILHELAGKRRLLLYSFGPNRRRDTPLERLEGNDGGPIAMDGDDIGILVDMALSQSREARP
jgi:hypothetical protein